MQIPLHDATEELDSYFVWKLLDISFKPVSLFLLTDDYETSRFIFNITVGVTNINKATHLFFNICKLILCVHIIKIL